MRYIITQIARAIACCALAFSIVALAPSSSSAQVNVLTQHNDNSRTGDNLGETVLNTTNVNKSSFGLLFTSTVDGFIYAQPLYVSNLTINGVSHNVVFVATEHDSVYAFDADTGAQIWKASLGTPVPSTDYGTGYHDLIPEIGITGTPVIDLPNKILFVDSFTKDTSSHYHHYLHALNITNGHDQAGSPVEITGSVSGTSWDSSNGTLAFNPFQHLQRPALLLSNGILYVAFGSHGDYEPYHGWVFAYNESLQQQAIYCTTPNGQEGGIWMGGQGPVADSSGNVYVMVGNSDENSENNAGDFGESFVKLLLSGNSLTETDFFKPNNYDNLNANDTDLGSAGPMLIPGTQDLIGGGKEGVLYLVNTSGANTMGGLNLNNDQMLQEFQATVPEIDQSPIYWNSPASGPTIYVWASYGDYLKAFNVNTNTGLFNTSPYSEETTIQSPGLPGGCLSLSANGSAAGTGIVWASHAYNADANPGTVRGELDAFDATDLTKTLWTSVQDAARDDVGNCAKFAPPTVANGKVYLATFSKRLNVYGLLGTVQAPSVSITSPSNGNTFTAPATIVLNATASDPAAKVTKVSFYNGSDLIGSTGVSPYRVTWKNIQPGSYSLTAVAFTANQTQASSAPVAITVNPSPYAATVSIDCGGPAAGSFSADQDFSGGAADPGTTNPIDTSAVTNPAPQAVYQTAHDGNTTYAITGLLPGAKYTARLHFAELSATKAGQRKFIVAINGATVLPAFDIFKTAGGQDKAIVKQFTATADSTGAITITLTGVVGQATINGIELLQAPSVSFPGGFAGATGLTLNGSASLAASELLLTDGGGSEAGSVFFTNPVNITNFATHFTFQLTPGSNPMADGFTFTVQGVDPTALGGLGGGLGYGADTPGGPTGIGHSVAIKFDLYNNAGEGTDSTGLYVNGASPTFPATDLSSTGIDLHSGHAFHVAITSNGSTVVVKIVDATTAATVTETYNVNVPATVGSSMGYVGFTGGTGGLTAVQAIKTWSVSP